MLEDGSGLKVGRYIPKGFCKYILLSHPLVEKNKYRILGAIQEPNLSALVGILETTSMMGPQECWIACWEGWGELKDSLQSLTGQKGWSAETYANAHFKLNLD
jgi:hypothetical protein